MKLIVGLGNPDKKYAKTRHNVGYMIVDGLAEQEKTKFYYEQKFLGLVADYNINGNKAILLKPVTYMNLSGRSVIKVINYFKIPIEDVLIIYDDADVNLGSIKLRLTGGSGGHKGMEDIINNLHTKDIKRLRVGIGKDENMIDFVLSKFSKAERKIIEPVFDTSKEVISEFVKGIDFHLLMNEFNRS